MYMGGARNRPHPIKSTILIGFTHIFRKGSRYVNGMQYNVLSFFYSATTATKEKLEFTVLSEVNQRVGSGEIAMLCHSRMMALTPYKLGSN